MKKSLVAFTVACMFAALGAGSVQAQELPQNATPEQIAAFEAEHFVSFDKINADGDAKAAENLIAATNEGAEGSDAKCWFWGWRYYSYPTYYYYTWYCPCYYVPLRLVTYTVPTVQTVVTPAVGTTTVETSTVAPTTTTTTTTTTPAAAAPAASTSTETSATAAATPAVDPSTVAIAKSSGKTACGAVVDQTVPKHSPLAKLGVKVGDVITHVDGVQVKSLVDLRNVKADSKLTVISGSLISVSKQQINCVPNENAAKALATDSKLDVGEKTIDENETMSLYEYYEALQKNAK